MRRRQFVQTSGAMGLAVLAGCMSEGRSPGTERLATSADHERRRGEPTETDSLLFAVTPETLWSFETEGKVIATPSIANGRAYIGSQDGYLYAFREEGEDGSGDGDESFRMFKVDRTNTSATGNRGPRRDVEALWRFDTGGPLWGSPAVVGERLYVGCQDGIFYCLDAATGTELWRLVVGGAVSPATVVDGTVYFATVKVGGMKRGSSARYEPEHPGNLYALDAATGDVEWVFRNEHRILSPPAVDDGRVFVGDRGGRFFGVDADTGDEVWRFAGASDSFCGTKAALGDGVLFMGNHDGHLYAIDTDDGSAAWSFRTDDRVASSAVVTDDGVYVGSLDERLYGIDRDSGEELWRFDADGPVASSPGYRDGTLYVGTSGNTLLAVNSRTGDGIWSYEVERSIISSPVITEDAIYIGSNDGNVYALRNALLEEEREQVDGGDGPHAG